MDFIAEKREEHEAILRAKNYPDPLVTFLIDDLTTMIQKHLLEVLTRCRDLCVEEGDPAAAEKIAEYALFQMHSTPAHIAQKLRAAEGIFGRNRLDTVNDLIEALDENIVGRGGTSEELEKFRGLVGGDSSEPTL